MVTMTTTTAADDRRSKRHNKRRHHHHRPTVGRILVALFIAIIVLFLGVSSVTLFWFLPLPSAVSSSSSSGAGFLPSSLLLSSGLVHLEHEAGRSSNTGPSPSYGSILYPLDVEDEDEDEFEEKLSLLSFSENTNTTNATSRSANARFTEQQQQHIQKKANNNNYDALPAAIVTRNSNQHLYNQDRAFIIQPFVTEQTPTGTGTGTAVMKGVKSFLVAILDGHSIEGHHVAEYLVRAIPARLTEKLAQRPCCQNDDEWIMNMMNETFIEVNDEAPPQNALRGGSTASVTLRIGNKLYIANAGDSQTMLIRTTSSNKPREQKQKQQQVQDEAEILYRTRKDKAHLPEELARIENLGGKVHIPPKFPGGSRVIVYSTAARPPETIGLAMSRSIGDWEWKVIGVTAEPRIDVVSVKGNNSSSINDNNGNDDDDDDEFHYFLMAASDGMWGTRRPEFLAKRIGETIRQYYSSRSRGDSSAAAAATPITTSSSLFLYRAFRQLVLDVSPMKKEWYRDDMTLAFVLLS